ncbi:hypothetical protein NP233_g524 [Leucocoprinus birnbaumii]|uniref:HMG box domain-containing protein n=1 Tax=Leucocoprinus birnbaumii TaxID=56174 RepID=A0AAD5W209_9AGAR|nr:hypothetical protein NP233_g524 [Leucocoprinus birnbaumii]
MHFSPFFVDPTAPSTMQPSDLPCGSDSPHFSFDPRHPESHSFSAPLIDYSIFDTPVDISLGALPPRPTASRALAQGRIPRPRNAFMLFRSAFHREKRLTNQVEKDHRHISRIIAHCWSELPEVEKDVWRQKAELEKQQHALAYPEYRFKPTPRSKPPVKRNVKRNSPKEIERCRKIAKLLQDGKSGEELTHAVRHLDGDQLPLMSPGGSAVVGGREEKKSRKQRAPDRLHPPIHERPEASHVPSGPSLDYYAATDGPPPFRSPLLPPSDFPQEMSKRPYQVAALGPTNAPLAQSATDINTPLIPANNSNFAQPYVMPDYIPRELDRTSKFSWQRPPNGQHATMSEWTPKDSAPTPFDQTDLREALPSTVHYSHYASAAGFRGIAHPAYTPDGQFLPSAVDQWGTCYREDGTARTFGEPTMPVPSGYETWSNTNSNASASPVQSDSPITAL